MYVVSFNATCDEEFFNRCLASFDEAWLLVMRMPLDEKTAFESVGDCLFVCCRLSLWCIECLRDLRYQIRVGFELCVGSG